jgi:hypothetical protein
MRGTVKVWRFRSSAVMSRWTRYTSFGESGSTKDCSAGGTLMKGGIGPETELGVEAPDEPGVEAGVLRPDRLADFAMVGLVIG